MNILGMLKGDMSELDQFISDLMLLILERQVEEGENSLVSEDETYSATIKVVDDKVEVTARELDFDPIIMNFEIGEVEKLDADLQSIHYALDNGIQGQQTLASIEKEKEKSKAEDDFSWPTGPFTITFTVTQSGMY
ncbi:MAG: hypothetical protein ACRCXZ_06640 [Patescibacteria group bacterium]